jgi:hypothetical protein
LPHDTAARPKRPAGWPSVREIPAEEAEAFGTMIETLRGFLDKVTGARPNAAMTAALTHDLAAWAERLDGCTVEERDQLFGRLLQQPGRGQTMTPALVVERQVPGEVVGTVTFGRYFVGVNKAVHGGALPLIFDEVLGRAASSPERPRIRTAYLNTAFRALTPIDVPLHVRGWLDRAEGRKFFVRGEIRHGDVVCADAEGLFVELRPEQG